MQTISYFFRTIYDIGFLRTFGRIKFEVKKKIFHLLPGILNLKISNCDSNSPQFRRILKNLKSQKIIFKNYIPAKNAIKFDFLND